MGEKLGCDATCRTGLESALADLETELDKLPTVEARIAYMQKYMAERRNP